MKRAFAFVLCLLLLGSSVPVHATEISAATTTILENGLRVVDEVTIVSSSARSTEKNATRTKTFYDGDTLIAVAVPRICSQALWAVASGSLCLTTSIPPSASITKVR